jgi:hypothetical protein
MTWIKAIQLYLKKHKEASATAVAIGAMLIAAFQGCQRQKEQTRYYEHLLQVHKERHLMADSVAVLNYRIDAQMNELKKIRYEKSIAIARLDSADVAEYIRIITTANLYP